MRYTLALVSLLVNFTYAQCDYSNEYQCSNQASCEWIENIEPVTCASLALDEELCEAAPECTYSCDDGGGYFGWCTSSCYGQMTYIDNSYCQEIEMSECSEMSEQQCNQDGGCEWTDAVSYGNCDNYNSSWTCDANDECWWDLCYGGWYGSWSGCCRGGTYQIDNSYCDDISFVPGDTNGDGFLNVSDVVLIVQIILSGDYDYYSDYNQDGIINITDVIGIINTILGE